MEALVISFIILLLLGVPVVFVLGISMLAYFVSTDQLQFLLVLPQRMFACVMNLSCLRFRCLCWLAI